MYAEAASGSRTVGSQKLPEASPPGLKAPAYKKDFVIFVSFGCFVLFSRRRVSAWQ
jgi:hypothetical protein